MTQIVKGDKIHYHIMSDIGSDAKIIKEIIKVSERYKHPFEKLTYERNIFYFQDKKINKSEWGWVDTAQITYTE